MRFLRTWLIWAVLLILWLPLLALDVIMDADSFAPGGDTPHCIFGGLGGSILLLLVTLWLVSTERTLPMMTITMVLLAGYLCVGMLALREVEIGPIQTLKPR